jgi:hypothetical protein
VMMRSQRQGIDQQLVRAGGSNQRAIMDLRGSTVAWKSTLPDRSLVLGFHGT